jgi:hypothetical protein
MKNQSLGASQIKAERGRKECKNIHGGGAGSFQARAFVV